MKSGRLFLDTAFVQALLNKNDDYHAVAKVLLPTLRAATEVWTTEAVLTEIGNAFSATQREAAASFIEQSYTTSNMQVVSVDTELFHKALVLYRERADKDWGREFSKPGRQVEYTTQGFVLYFEHKAMMNRDR